MDNQNNSKNPINPQNQSLQNPDISVNSQLPENDANTVLQNTTATNQAAGPVVNFNNSANDPDTAGISGMPSQPETQKSQPVDSIPQTIIPAALENPQTISSPLQGQKFPEADSSNASDNKLNTVNIDQTPFLTNIQEAQKEQQIEVLTPPQAQAPVPESMTPIPPAPVQSINQADISPVEVQSTAIPPAPVAPQNFQSPQEENTNG